MQQISFICKSFQIFSPLFSVSHCKFEIRPVGGGTGLMIVILVIGFVLCCVNFRLREEPHTVEEYSGIGLTSDWYALSLK